MKRSLGVDIMEYYYLKGEMERFKSLTLAEQFKTLRWFGVTFVQKVQ
jgi:hypothetical protein